MTYWHTVRHLRPVQIYGRIRFRLARPGTDTRPAPTVRARTAPWSAPVQRQRSMTDSARFDLLGDTRDLEQTGWDDPGVDKLWRYHLHYFDDLNAAAAPDRAEWHRALMTRWLRENPPGRGTGWEPYPTSLRIVNWIKWALGGRQLSAECLHSLAVQARWLSRRLEKHLLGNHLFANAKALLFAGAFFDGAEARAWRETGARILRDQLDEQFLADGGQFELTPMYHALALEDLLDLTNLAAAFPGVIGAPVADTEWRARVHRARAWLLTMCHPDGEISFFNDAAIGTAPSPAELDAYAARLSLPTAAPHTRPLTLLANSGYARLERGDAVALLDVAEVGPAYLPAHAHADTLSFELSLFGQRVLVNSGTSVYGTGSERERQRGTAAHTTVVLDGANSSEVWAGFRVARRAHPVDLTSGTLAEGTTVECAHDGYRRLRGRPVHRRRWTMHEQALTITDHVAGSFRTAEARFHLHPEIRALDAGVHGETWRAELGLAGGRSATVEVRGARVRLEPATWHPSFGKSVPSQCIAATFTNDAIVTVVRWGTA